MNLTSSTGAEFEADERGLIDELAQFDFPEQDDLDLLILADLFVEPRWRADDRAGVA